MLVLVFILVVNFVTSVGIVVLTVLIPNVVTVVLGAKNSSVVLVINVILRIIEKYTMILIFSLLIIYFTH